MRDLSFFRDREPGVIGAEQLRHYAVVIPVIETGGRQELLFEVRSERLDRQPGDICFPGGAVEDGETPAQAAVREVTEELLVDSSQIELIGQSDSFAGGARHISVFVGRLTDYDMRWSEDEVADVFTVPLDFFLENEPEVYRVPLVMQFPEDFPFDRIHGGRSYRWRQPEDVIYFYEYEGRVIWGLTARLVHAFADIVRAREGSDAAYKYALFDLDGTLTDPGIGITNSVMYALGKYGISVADRSELYSFIGPPLVESFQRFFGFPEEQALQAVEYYREYFRTDGIFENSVYDGIPEMLEALKGRGVVIALATSKPYEFAVQILEHFGLRRYFDHIGAATMDGRVSKKRDVIAHLLQEHLAGADRSQILMIGDRDQDIDGAISNGLASAGVLWGYGSEEELRGAGADMLVGSPAELVGLVGSERRN